MLRPPARHLGLHSHNTATCLNIGNCRSTSVLQEKPRVTDARSDRRQSPFSGMRLKEGFVYGLRVALSNDSFIYPLTFQSSL